MRLIENALTQKGARLIFGARWMVWDSINKGWIIYERKRYLKNTKIILETVSEGDAVNSLLDQ